MSGAFTRTGAAAIPRLFKRYSLSDVVGESAGAPASFLSTQTLSRAHLRFPHFARKARDCELSPSLFSSAFSSSSSSSSAVVKDVGIVGWYLGMVKCRPILTKGVTSALIYTAADLSSQVSDFSRPRVFDI